MKLGSGDRGNAEITQHVVRLGQADENLLNGVEVTALSFYWRTNVKLSELKPCVCCGGPLLIPGVGNWYVLRQTIGILNPTASRQVSGMMQFFNGSMKLAEVFTPDAENAVFILCDHPNAPKASEIHVCLGCYIEKFGNLPWLFEASDEYIADLSKKTADAIISDRKPKVEAKNDPSAAIENDTMSDLGSGTHQGQVKTAHTDK